MMRFKICTFAAALLLCSAASVFAGPNSSSTEEIFVTNAAQAGLAEVMDGRLAVANGSSSVIRTIGQRMITDHTKANKMLASIARADSLIVPAMPNASDRTMIAKQKMLSGSAFDTAYLNWQRTAHQHTLDLFKTELAQGSNPRLLVFAKQTLPTIQKHLEMFQAARDSM